MNKKVMALAVAGALAAPAVAFAQASNVSIYGRANVGFGTYEAAGATNDVNGNLNLAKRNRVWDTGSRLGFRVNEDLGGGLRAFVQIENGVSLDNGSTTGQGGQANSSAGTFASRDSFAGIGTRFGDVRFGRQSVYWAGGAIQQSGANYVDTEIGFMNGASFGRVAGPSARTNNVLSVTTATFGGFNATISYAPQNEANQGSATVGTGGHLNGVTARYNGVVNVQVDIASNSAAAGGTLGSLSKIEGQKIGIGYPYMPGAQISVITATNKNTFAAGVGLFAAAGDVVKQTSMNVNWEHMFGNIQVLAAYGKLAKAKGCTETITAVQTPGATGAGTTCEATGAKAIDLAVKYHLSKRTGVYVAYHKIENESNNTADYGGAAMTSANTLPVGADPKIMSIGVMHNF